MPVDKFKSSIFENTYNKGFYEDSFDRPFFNYQLQSREDDRPKTVDSGILSLTSLNTKFIDTDNSDNLLDTQIHNFKPIDNEYGNLIDQNSGLEVNILLPNNSEHDYIGCIMGYGGTTINLIQKITHTEIKIEHTEINQFIKISPKFKFKKFEENIEELNVASIIIMTIIKLKHTEDVPNSKYNIFKEWQDNENKIMVKLNKEILKMIDSKIDVSFINRYRLKLSITKLLKESGELDIKHNSEELPKLFDDFVSHFSRTPDLSNISKLTEFKRNFNKKYDILLKKYFESKNIIIRGSLIIDGYININFRNYSNLFVDIHEYEYDYVERGTIIKSIPTKSSIQSRSKSCTPTCNFYITDISEPRPRKVSIYT